MTKKFRRLGVRQSSVENHPQKQLIVDALLAGCPVREIAGWTIPPVGRMALQRFRSQHVVRALQHAMTNTKALARSPIQRALKEWPDSTELVAAARAEIEHGPVLAVRQKRLELLQERHNRLNLIVDERGADMAGVPGGKSGFLARDYKSDGREIYKVDGVLLSELREIEKQSAIETGEWQEHTAPGVMIQIVMPAVPPRGEPSEDAVIDVAVIKR